MYADSFNPENWNQTGAYVVAVCHDISERYPSVAACLGGIRGDGTKARPDIPPATLFVSVGFDGLRVTISPKDYPRIATVNVSGATGDFLQALESALLEDRIVWQDRWKPATGQARGK